MKKEKGEGITGMINHALIANATGDTQSSIRMLKALVGEDL